MNRVDWPRLMRLGLVELGLAPAVFWDLTPAELFLLAGVSAPQHTMTRASLAELLARFPDNGRTQARPEE